MKTFAIIGTGAIGGFCAFKLQEAGCDVFCLFANDYEAVKQQGLKIISQNKETTIRVNAYKNADDMPKCDVIIVSIKSTANTILEEILLKVMHEDSIVVVMQNGIGIENELSAFIQPEKIIGAISILKVTKELPGVIKHFGFSEFEFAQFNADEKKSGITKPVEEIAAIFKKAGFDSIAMPHLPTIRWKKLISNIPLSGLSILLNASTMEMVNNADSYSLLCAMTREVIDAAKKCGAQIPDDFYQHRLDRFEKFKTMEKNYPSMYGDFKSKKPLELHAIYDNAIKRALEHGMLMPMTNMLYRQLCYLNKKI